MYQHSTRREFLTRIGTAAAGAALARSPAASALAGAAEPSKARVVVARDDQLTRGKVGEHAESIRKLLDAGMQKLTGATDAESAWRTYFRPGNRIGIKVNTLGLATQPAVVDAIVAGLRRAGVPADNILIWDRFDVELRRAGFRINKSTTGPRCYGTDGDRIGSGYLPDIESSGRIGSCYSRIVAEKVDTLICVPVLKDHNLAGVSLGLKNFYGAIHNPNKYHDHNCDPYVADVVRHRYIAPKWKLTVCDAMRAQYHAGPGRSVEYAWPFGGMIISDDIVAADAVAADLLEAKRATAGLPTLAIEKRPTSHIATAARVGLGTADRRRIQRIEV